MNCTRTTGVIATRTRNDAPIPGVTSTYLACPCVATHGLGSCTRMELGAARSSRQPGSSEKGKEVHMNENDNLVIGTRDLSGVRDRLDLSHGDPSTDAGGDGHGDAGGDGLNIPE